MATQAGQTLSHYRLIERIGEGGMGVVWKAEDTVLNRTVAIKVLPADVSRDQKRREMFLKEAQLASSISDAHIVQVYEFAREGDLDFIVMEYVEGKPLNKLIHGRPLPPDKVAELARQVARALSRAHRKGLLHRDLKPGNIMVTPDGDVKVLDFGLAVLFERRDTSLASDDATRAPSAISEVESERRPAGWALAGTLAYMSPEQVRMERLDARSDIFSLGTVLYEMTTGQHPFAGRTIGDLLQEILKARSKPVHELVSKVPLDLDRIIHKALARRRTDRYQTMEDLAVDLKRLGRELESGSSPSYEAIMESLAPRRRKKVILGTLATAAGLLALASGAWLVGSRLGSGGPAAGDDTLLVLPMAVRGQAEGGEFAGHAFAEAMAANLAEMEDLNVMPVPSAVPASQDGAFGPADAAREVGAGWVLTGALTRRGEIVQVSVSLTDARENRLLWGAQREAPEDRMPALASALARGVAKKLGTSLPRLYGIPEDSLATPERTASTLWSEAVGAIWRHDLGASLEATDQLVEAFPDEPDAHALRVKARLEALKAVHSEDNRQAVEQAVVALDRLDPEHPAAEIARGFIEGGAGRIREAVARFTALLDREDLTRALRAEMLTLRGWNRLAWDENEAAIEDLEEALQLSPTNGEAFAILGTALRTAGRPEEGLVRGRQAVALSPSNPLAHFEVGLTLGVLGRWEEAHVAAGKACVLGGGHGPCAWHALALHMAGREAEARAAAEKVMALPEDVSGAYNLACYWARAGNRSEAIRYLRSAVEHGMAIAYMARDPDLESLHGDPEFEAIVAEVNKRIGEE